MDKDSEMLEKVIIFLVVLVSAILIFTQYEFYNLSNGGILFYASALLIAALAGLILWILFNRKSPEHHHAVHEHAKIEKHAVPMNFTEKLTYGLVALVAVMIIFNQMQISQASALMGVKSGFAEKLSFRLTSSSTSLKLTGDPSKDALTLIPKGTRFYSEGLGV